MVLYLLSILLYIKLFTTVIGRSGNSTTILRSFVNMGTSHIMSLPYLLYMPQQAIEYRHNLPNPNVLQI